MRLFVAIDIPQAVREAIGELITRLRVESRDAKWVRPEVIHVTLKFIGEADAKQLDPIRTALASVHAMEAVEMQFRGLGFFPDARRPHVLWCGIAASPSLAELAAGVERALEPLGIPRESREFVPHLTLARLRPDRGPRRQLEKLVRAADELKSYDFGSARETEFHLIESQTKPSGAEYKTLESFPIVKGS